MCCGREAEAINLELKCSDHSGNPYLAMGAMIAAGLDGINNKIDPGEPQEIDPGNYSDEERERRGIPRPRAMNRAATPLSRSVNVTPLGRPRRVLIDRARGRPYISASHIKGTSSGALSCFRCSLFRGTGNILPCLLHL